LDGLAGKAIFHERGPTGKGLTEERKKSACIRIIPAIAISAREALPFAGGCSRRKKFLA
jgi:hypothetical protein